MISSELVMDSSWLANLAIIGSDPPGAAVAPGPGMAIATPLADSVKSCVESIVSDRRLVLPRPRNLLLELVAGQQLGIARFRYEPRVLEGNERSHLLAARYQDGLHILGCSALCGLVAASLASWETRADPLALTLEHRREPAMLQAFVHPLRLDGSPDIVVVLREAIWKVTPVRAWPALEKMSERQREVATLLAGSGMSFAEMADALGISPGTMRKHAENIYRLAGVRSRAELTAAARSQPQAPRDEMR